jgi:inhibitor of nuclear factor kappa-B kinase subunit alpha
MVYRTIKRFLDTGSNDERPKMRRQRTVRTPAIVKVIRERIRRNCGRSARKTARQLEINRETVRKIFKDDLTLKPFNKRKVHGLSEATKKKRIERSKHILAWHAGDETIFSDEKMFVLEQSQNSQNDRAWSVSIQDIPEDKQHVPRFQNAASIMVWGAISPRGKLPLIFIEMGVKINANYYLEEVLKKNVIPNAKSLFGDDYYCFQQDGAPSHTANITQAWRKMNGLQALPIAIHSTVLYGHICYRSFQITNSQTCSNLRWLLFFPLYSISFQVRVLMFCTVYCTILIG